MPRGENPEFKDRVGQLSMRLKRLNVERKIDAHYGSEFKDLVDIEAYLTEDERFSEIWESVEKVLERVDQKDFEDMTDAEVQNEIEKYRSIAEGYDDLEFSA